MVVVIVFIYNLLLSLVVPFIHIYFLENPGPKEAIELLISSDEKLFFRVSIPVTVNG